MTVDVLFKIEVFAEVKFCITYNDDKCPQYFALGVPREKLY